MVKRIIEALLCAGVTAYAVVRLSSNPWLYAPVAGLYAVLTVLSLLGKTGRGGFLVHIGVVFFFLDLTFRKTRWEYLLDFFGRVNYLWLPAIFAGTLLNVAFRAVKWKLLFPKPGVRISHLLEATAIGFMANNIFPARAGEFIRAFVASDRTKLSKSLVLTTVFLERVMDGVALTCFFVLLVIAAPLDRSRFAVYSVLAIAMYAVFLSVAVLFYFFKPFFERIILWFVGLIRPSATGKVRGFVDKIHSGLHLLRNGKSLLLFFGLTLANWGFNQFVVWLCCRSVDLLPLFGITSVSWYFASLFLLVLICFAISIPSGPGGAGPYQYIIQLALLVMAPAMAGDSRLLSAAAGFSLYVWLSQAIPIILAGFVYYGRSGYSFKGLQKKES
jgi:uncharacterized protein (TIRG00374 family)